MIEKKNYIFILMFTLVLSGGFSQTDTPSESVPYHMYIGLYGGYTNNTLYGHKVSEEYRNRNADGKTYGLSYSDGGGFTIGIPVRYQIYPWLAVAAEPTFITKNYSWKKTGNDSTVNKAYLNVTNSFLDFPVMVNFSKQVGPKNMRLYANAGAFIGVWLASHLEGKSSTVSPNVFDQSSSENQYADIDQYISFDSRRDNQFDAGLLIGGGLQYSFRAFTIFAEARFNYSLTDLQKPYDTIEPVPNMNDTWAFFAGIIFNAGLFEK